MRAELERRLGRTLPAFTLPPHPAGRADHLGIGAQRQEGLSTIGIPVHVGLVTGDRLIALADLAQGLGGDVRVTRQQNLVLTGVPAEDVPATVAALEAAGLELDVNPVRGSSIACTGEPHCNFSVTETKTRLDALIQGLERSFGDGLDGLRLHLDGCPHACAQHWVGDLGFQGTTVRDEAGKRRQAYEIYVRGALGADAAIGRPLFRRVPSEDLDDVVGGLVGGWLARRRPGETFPAFATRSSDEQLEELAGVAAAPRKGGGAEEAA
jgi:ferredoxin-nitrite reductase